MCPSRVWFNGSWVLVYITSMFTIMRCWKWIGISIGCVLFGGIGMLDICLVG